MGKIAGRTILDTNQVPQTLYFTCTLAELNAGKVLIPAIAGRTIQVSGFLLLVTGTFATLTDARLSDVDSAGAFSNDLLTVVAAQLGTGVEHGEQKGTNTKGAAFWAPLTIGRGLAIRKTGSTATGGTDIKGYIRYTYTTPA